MIISIPGIVSQGGDGLPSKGRALDDYTWEEISLISQAGKASEYFSVGNTKDITLNGKVKTLSLSNYSVKAFIIGINHNSSLEGTNRIHFEIGKVGTTPVCFCDSRYGTYEEDGSTSYFSMNEGGEDYTNEGGWEACNMRKYILGNAYTPSSPGTNTFLSVLPSDLRAVMRSVTKYSDNQGLGLKHEGYITATTDYLFLASEVEIGGSPKYGSTYASNKQTQYDYYKSGNSAVKKKHNSTGTSAKYWTRSVGANAKEYWVPVSTSGSISLDGLDGIFGIAPCFCV